MHANPESSYTPVLDARDRLSLPRPDLDQYYVGLRPGRAIERGWKQWAPAHVWGHFLLPDATLLRLERRDPLGLGLAAAYGVEGILTMDTPLYGFMTRGQRERAQAIHLHRLLRTVDQAPRLGLAVTPLVKALDAASLNDQLDLLEEMGHRRAAFSAREHRLEHDESILRRFIRGCHRRRIHPLLVGAFTPSILQYGPVEAASQRHYVLARRGTLLPPFAAEADRFRSPWWSEPLDARDVAALCRHNFEAARARLVSRNVTGLGG